jgi:type I restriction enzyme S subunit
MRSSYKKIGDYIREVNARNRQLTTNTLLGINIDKYYMPSVANIVGTDMSVYKIVKKNQFACNRMHVGRDKKLPVALSDKNEDFIVSPAYDVFEIIDENILLPEYLMMWFSRKEFDRNAWFYTDADVRGGLPWKSFCEMDLPVPHPDKQKEIIKEYHTIANRINLNNQLIQKLEETAQAIYKQWFVDFEFPAYLSGTLSGVEGYKSIGGEMVQSELGVIPKGWKYGKIGDMIDVINGYAFGSNDFKEFGKYPIIKIASIISPYVDIGNSQYYSGEINFGIKKSFIESGDILISMTGSHMNQINSAVGKIGRYNYSTPAIMNQRVGKIKSNQNIPCNEFIYRFMIQEETQNVLLMGATGSANQANISPDQIKSLMITKPSNSILITFDKIVGELSRNIVVFENQNRALLIMKNLMLSKLATIEN